MKGARKKYLSLIVLTYFSMSKPGMEGEGGEIEMDQDQNRTELTQVEIALCK